MFITMCYELQCVLITILLYFVFYNYHSDSQSLWETFKTNHVLIIIINKNHNYWK